MYISGAVYKGVRKLCRSKAEVQWIENDCKVATNLHYLKSCSSFMIGWFSITRKKNNVERFFKCILLIEGFSSLAKHARLEHYSTDIFCF